MPMFVEGSRGKDAIGIPIQLREWSEYDGQVAAVGERLDSGHEAEVVAVVLSTRDRHADNPNRRSLAEWRDGYQALRREFRLEVGGIVLFKNCRQISAAVYVSTWPNILASSREEASNVCKANNAIMRVAARAGVNRPVGDGQHTGSTRLGNRTEELATRGSSRRGLWGDVVVFYPEAAVTCGKESSAADEAFRLANLPELREPMFLLRGLNAAGEVVAATKVALSRKRELKDGQEVYLLPSAEELAQAVEDYAVAIRNLPRTIAAFNLLPAGRWLLSPRTFFAPNRTESTVSVSRAFRQQVGDKEVYVAKEVLFKLSEESRDNAQYVNAIYPVDPFGSGRNIDLLGGLDYAKDAILTAVRPEAGAEPVHSATTTGAKPKRNETPFRAGQPVTRESPLSGDGVARGTGIAEDPFAGIPSVRARLRP